MAELTDERTLDILYQMRDTNAERLKHPQDYPGGEERLQKHYENILRLIRRQEKRVFGEEDK